jgi:hypothetical protein
MQKREVGQWIFNLAVLAVLVGAFASIVWLSALAIRESGTIAAAMLAALPQSEPR